MNTPRKFWLALIGGVLATAVIACSVGSTIPTPTVSPSPVIQSSPTLLPSPVQSMAGRWIDPGTMGTITTIMAQEGGFAVKSVINPTRGGNELTATNWSNGVLTWTYCIPNANCITNVTVSLDGNSLYTTWTDDSGNSGQTTFLRLA
jgi:hypothetical protein